MHCYLDRFYYPVSSYFNDLRDGQKHAGIDIRPKSPNVNGDKIYSFMSGTIMNCGTDSNSSKACYVRHTYNPYSTDSSKPHLQSRYVHLQTFGTYKKDDPLTKGQNFAAMGDTGYFGGEQVATHLHFGLQKMTIGQTSTSFSIPDSIDPLLKIFPNTSPTVVYRGIEQFESLIDSGLCINKGAMYWNLYWIIHSDISELKESGILREDIESYINENLDVLVDISGMLD